MSLARREFRARYAGSALGGAWTLLEPAIYFGLYLLVFAGFLGTRLEVDPGVGSFAFYLVAGLVPFMALQEVVVRAASLARANAGMLRHASLPLEVVLAALVGSVLARHAIGLGLVLGAAAGFGVLDLSRLPLLLAGVLLLVALSWGVGLVLVPAGAFLPDVAMIAGSGMTVLFFLTPIVYPMSMLPAVAQGWLAANPVVGVLELFRAAIGGGPVDLVHLSVSAATALAVVAGGSLVFSRRAHLVPDVV